MKKLIRGAIQVVRDNDCRVILVCQNKHPVLTIKLPDGMQRKLAMSATPKDMTTALWRFTADFQRLLKDHPCASTKSPL